MRHTIHHNFYTGKNLEPLLAYTCDTFISQTLSLADAWGTRTRRRASTIGVGISLPLSINFRLRQYIGICYANYGCNRTNRYGISNRASYIACWATSFLKLPGVGLCISESLTITINGLPGVVIAVFFNDVAVLILYVHQTA